MTLPRSLLLTVVANLLIACGGQAEQMGSSHTGGNGGTASGPHGHAGSGGNTTSGGSSSGGSSSSGVAGTNASAGTGAGGSSSKGGASSGGVGGGVCCNAFPTCASGERLAGPAECPGQANCQQRALCCSSIWCVPSDGGAGASGTHDCVGATCTATQACVSYRTVGGARFTPDAGVCPSGQHEEGGACQADFAYACRELNGTCANQAVTCACAAPPTNNPGACPAGFGSCSEPGPTVDSSVQLICQRLVP